MNGSARARSCACLVLMFAAVGCDPNVVIGYAPDAKIAHDASPIPGATDAATVSDAARPRDTGMPDTGPLDTGAPDAGPPNIEITWVTGAHSGTDLADYTRFGDWRGRPLEIATVYPERTRWDGIVNPAWPIDMLRDFSGRLVLSLPLYPEGGGYNNQDCAAGMYDSEWRKLGTYLVARSRGDSILRLGWGWNDLEHEWRADADPTDWIACYQKVVAAIRPTGPSLRYEWSFNPPGSPMVMPVDPYLAYPGDAFVDFVSFEAFDMYPPLRNESEWNAHCSRPGGLCRLFDFARQHGKKVGFGEWGIATCGADPGGDNAFFVQRMVQAFSENRTQLAYEAYFEESGDVCSVISFNNTQAPKAAARYKALYAK